MLIFRHFLIHLLITGLVITRVMFGANFSSLSYEGKSAALQMAHFIDERMIEALKPWLQFLVKRNGEDLVQNIMFC